jgi:Bacterial PH domain
MVRAWRAGSAEMANELDRERRTFRYEPGRFRFNGASIALMSCATPAFILLVALESPSRYVAAGLALTPAPWAVRRAFRVSLAVTEDGVTVKNYWRTYSFPWSDVEGVGIALAQQGVLPQPALAFKFRNGGAVFAQATPVRRSERHEFQAAVLALAPSTVTPLPDTAAPIGADWALSNKLRLWWLRNEPPRVPLQVQARENVWIEQPFPFSLFFAVCGLVASGLVVVLGASVLVGPFKDNAGSVRYLVALLLLVAGALGCVWFALILKKGARPTRK